MKLRIGILVSLLLLTMVAQAQSTGFTYQGKLTDGGNAANGSFDLQFSLFDNSNGGSQVGSTLTRSGTAVANGVFTVQLDFGVNAFPGANRFLEIGVRPVGTASFTLLSPRQQISSTPYAIHTLNAATADGLSSACVSCVQNSQINSVAGSKISGSIPVASVPAGSANYIQNTTIQQPNANFHIGGNGQIAGNLTTNGSLGIGIDPQAPLHIRASNTLVELEGQNGTALIRFSNPVTSYFTGLNSSNNYIITSGNGLGLFTVSQSGNVGIGTSSAGRLLHVNGRARIGLIPLGEFTASVCFNGVGDLLQCGASSLKLKTNISPFPSGLDVVRRLNPISFDWKDGSGHDIGLGAEDVAKVAPSLTITDKQGEVAGVKYERLIMLLINAIKEQQQQIEKQQKQIAQIQTANSKLKSRLRTLENGQKKKSRQVRYSPSQIQSPGIKNGRSK